MSQNFTYTLQDGKLLEIAAGTDTVIKINSAQVFPAVVVDDTGVLDFSKGVISTVAKSGDVVTVGAFKFASENKYTSPLTIATIGGKSSLKANSYSEKLRLTRVDGKAFDIASLDLVNPGMPADAGGSIAYTKDGTTSTIAIPTFAGDKVFTLALNLTQVSNLLISFHNYAPAIQNVNLSGGVPIIVDPVPAKIKKYFGMISDTSSYALNKAAMDEFGFDSTRIWLGFDPATGKLWNLDSVNRANQFAQGGVQTSILLAPDTNVSNVVFPQSAINDLIVKLDKRVYVHIFNEVNSSIYWPGGNIAQAFDVASRISTQLQAAGFKTGSPSFAYNTVSTQVQWYKERAAAKQMNFNRLVTHNYPFWDTSSNYEGPWLNNFEEMLKGLNDYSASLNLPLVIDEWGFSPQIPHSKIALLLKNVKAMFEKYNVMDSNYFIMTLTGTVAQPHLPHDQWAWLVDLKGSGARQEDVIAAFKSVKS